MPPELPTGEYSDMDSLLSRKYGKEVLNYFSGSPLNRVSFLRDDTAFLNAAVTHASTRFLLLRDLAPLTSADGADLALLPFSDVEPVLGPGPTYFRPEKALLDAYDADPAARAPLLIFLGLDDRAAPPAAPRLHPRYAGAACFALDLSAVGARAAAATALSDALTSSSLAGADGGAAARFAWTGSRMRMTLPARSAALFAPARHLLDWHARNGFCAACGARTNVALAGWKRLCPAADLLPASSAGKGEEGEGAQRVLAPRGACPARGHVSNTTFPRTDAVLIMAIVDAAGARVLLGRQPRYPPGMYSTLAGFLEPGESVDECARREAWEEAGVRLARVVVHSSQPWPYPANLMVGVIAQAVGGAGEAVDLGHDPELEDAKWWSFEEVRKALKGGPRAPGLGASDRTGEEKPEAELMVPPRTAIAHLLMDAVVNGGFLAGGARM